MTNLPLVIPHERLDTTVLQAILEDFATRDGTDYGEHPMTLEQKVALLRRQLLKRQIHVLYDPGSEQLSLLTTEDLSALGIPLG
jgi:uncharacterized protein